MTNSLESLFEADRALVFGLGGGGDVVSTIPTARLLEANDVEVVLGGVSWIPAPRDPRPGPRSLDELEGVDPIADRVGRATARARTRDGVELPEGGVASHVDNRTLVFDMSGGAPAVASSVATVVDRDDIDAVVGVDAGGDAIAVGDEPGIRSPITDAVGLSILEAVDAQTALGVIGFGSDGELGPAELTDAFESLAGQNAVLGAWGITPAIRDEMVPILETVDTEASRLPVLAAGGEFGERTIRGGLATVDVGPMTPITVYVEPHAVIERSAIVSLVRQADALDEAARRLRDRGIQTEFDTERARVDDE